MTNVDRLFAEYIAEHRAGGDADPRQYLSRLPRSEQNELAALIDGYLRDAPRQAFAPAMFRASSAERTVDELERSIAGQAGLWPAVLPRLRDQAGLKRSTLVERLAAALGAKDKNEKVASYYHEMEHGLLPSEGVSDRVLAALGQIVGETTQTLRDAGRALAPSNQAGRVVPGPAFARRTSAESPGAPPSEPRAAQAKEWDEVDQLFRGG